MALAINTQPSSVSNSRSPIFYKFTGADAAYKYTIDVLVDGVSYVLIERYSDKSDSVIVDIHNILDNYLKKNLEYNVNNVIGVQCICNEYDGATVNATVTTNTIDVLQGYTTYDEGVNYNRSGVFQACSDAETISLPNYGESVNDYYITYYIDAEGAWTLDYYNTGGTAQGSGWFGADTIKQIPCGYTNLTEDYGEQNPDINKPMVLKVYAGTTLLKTITINPITCNDNELSYLTFLNRFGVWDQIFITGRVDESLNVEYDTYNYDNMDYTTMDYARHGTYHKFITNGRNKLMLNTGWVLETLDEKIEELMLSEQVYYNDRPLLITSKDMKFKTHRWDKLINYTLNAEYAYDKINMIK